MKIRDIAWLAGLLEGEGYFTIKSGTKANLQLGIEMTDKEPVEKVARLTGGPLYGPYARYTHGKRCQDTLRMMITGSRAASWMMTLYSLMSPRRQKEIERALFTWRNFIPTHVSGFGVLKKRLGPDWSYSTKRYIDSWTKDLKCKSCGGSRDKRPLKNCEEPRHQKHSEKRY